jgi:hypothetical protein
MSFSVPVFPDLPYGFPLNKAPSYQGIVQTAGSGREVRRPQRQSAQWEYELTFEGLRDQTLNSLPYGPLAGYTEFQRLSGAFVALAGRYGLFFFDDPSDNSRLNQSIGVGNGVVTQFTIYRTFGASGFAASEPVGGINTGGIPFAIYFNGVPQFSGWGLADGSDGTGASVTFAIPPGAGVNITADFSFYYLCFFTEDQHDYDEFYKNYYALKSLKFRSTLPGSFSFAGYTPPPPAPPPPPPGPTCGTLSVSSGGTWDATSGDTALRSFSAGNTQVNAANSTIIGYPSLVVRSSATHSTGRYWVEWRAADGTTNLQLIWQLVGLMNGTPSTTGASYQLGSSGSDSFGLGSPFLGSSGLWLNGSGTHSFSTYSPRPYVDVCVNLTLKKTWLLTAVGVWNFDATADPNTNTGGWDISAMNAGPYYAAMSEIVRTSTTYPSIILVTNGNIGDALGARPMCYVPW